MKGHCNMKKILSVLLMAVLLIGMLPAEVAAAGAPEKVTTSVGAPQLVPPEELENHKESYTYNKPAQVSSATGLDQTEEPQDYDAAPRKKYNDAIVLLNEFIGSQWIVGDTIEIPFYMYSFGNYGEKYYVEIYNESQTKLLGTSSGNFPNDIAKRNLTIRWYPDQYPAEGGKFWVNFYSTYDRTYEDKVFAFYIKPPVEPEPDPEPLPVGWVNYGIYWAYYKPDGFCYES